MSRCCAHVSRHFRRVSAARAGLIGYTLHKLARTQAGRHCVGCRELYKEDFVYPRTAMAGTAVTFLSVTLAHVILRLRVAREIIGFLSVTDTYIHTNYFRDRRRISCLALRRSAISAIRYGTVVPVSYVTLAFYVNKKVARTLTE